MTLFILTLRSCRSESRKDHLIIFAVFSSKKNKKRKKEREREREAISISAATFITEGARREGKTRREKREERKRREKREEGGRKEGDARGFDATPRV